MGGLHVPSPSSHAKKGGGEAITEHRGRYDEEEGLSRVRSGYKTFKKERNDQVV